MLWFLRKYIYLVPQVQLAATFVVSFIDFDNGSLALYRLGHSVGYSILTGLAYVAYFCRQSFCAATRISSIGLLIISAYNLFGSLLPYETYDRWFDRIVFTICWLIALMAMYKDKKTK